MWTPWSALRRWRRLDSDFSEEINAHLALEADRLVAEGLSPRAAALEARRRFGNLTQVTEDFHRRRTVRWIEVLLRHTSRAARRLVHAPVFSSTVVLTLTLGIGATAAVFSLVDGVLLRPLPFARPGQLVDLSHSLAVHGITHVDQSDATYLYYAAANRVFSGIGAYRLVDVDLAAATADAAHVDRVQATRASASTFQVLGVPPLRGRVFQDDEDRPGSIPVVILSERLWRTRYAADPAMLGRRVSVDGVPHQVVGIMPSGFAFPDEQTALWLPIGIDPTRTESANFDLRAVARLRAGVTPEAAAAELQRLLPQVPEAYPGRLTAGAIALTRMRAVVRPLRDVIVGGIGRALWVVLGAAVCLLFTVCANVANLFLVRAEERQHEVAVRRALGAGRGEIAAEFLAEGLLLAATGGALGLAVAGAAVDVLRSVGSGFGISRLEVVGINGTVVAVTVGVVLLTALMTSFLPVFRTAGAASTDFLRTGRAATGGRGRHRARRAFVVAQVALALVLVTGAGLMARSFQRLRAVTPGFDAAHTYVFRQALPVADSADAIGSAALISREVDSVAQLPGVEAVGAISKLPLEAAGRRDTALFAEDRPPAMGAMPNVHQVVYASPDAFAALGMMLVEGRTFRRADPAHPLLDAIVTRALAKRYWGGSPAVGRRFRLAPDGPLFSVVGVTGDIHGTGLAEPPDETVFLPLVTAPGPALPDGGAGTRRWMPLELAIVVRAHRDPVSLAVPVERTLRALAPGVPVYGVRPMTDVVASSMARTSFTLLLLRIAAVAALLIGAVGLYGVVAYMVGLRAREMAVRIALGARPSALRRLVLRQALSITGIGVVLGLGATVLLTRFLDALLFDVAPTDPMTLFGSVVLLSAVAVVASWVPAQRAAVMDPVAVLRTDA
ncbi:MAG TPA: ABC transporter permease [Gemmatimonadales bacterium]|nr:ABC transporter permease [Gemmatimonadales bacterium]